MDLSQEKCVACRADSPRVTPEERRELSTQVRAWGIVEDEDGVEKLRRTFRFPDFVAALAFTQRVGELAEAEGHHPVLITEWGRVTVFWWTHKIRGLHRNDFIAAVKTDALFDEGEA